MAIPFLNLHAVNDHLVEEYMEELQKLFQSEHFILGASVQRFEEQFARYVGTKFGVGVNSGTDAVLLALNAMGIGPGDEVLLPAFSSGRCGDAIARLGATPIFVDVRPDTYCIDADLAMASVTSNTKAIIAVHLFGQACEVDKLSNMARTYSVSVLEDMRHAVGARLGNRRLGSFGRFGCFSFYPTRNLGAIGDAGLISTGDESAVEILRRLREHGRTSGKGSHETIGYNSRLDAVQASLLTIKLQDLDENNLERVENARLYTKLFKDSPVQTPCFRDDLSHVYGMYTIMAPDRDQLAAYLQEKGVGYGIYYPIPLHLQPAFQYLGYNEGAFPVAEDLANRAISIPVAPGLKKHHIEEVAATILEFYGEK
jgi:dTDP-4-amino-4,6-dideoxygalactose transaminase